MRLDVGCNHTSMTLPSKSEVVPRPFKSVVDQNGDLLAAAPAARCGRTASSHLIGSKLHHTARTYALSAINEFEPWLKPWDRPGCICDGEKLAPDTGVRCDELPASMSIVCD